MKILERRENSALVELTAELSDAAFEIIAPNGGNIIHVKRGKSVKIDLPYGAEVSVRYSDGNSDTLRLAAATTNDEIRKAAKSRFGDIKVGV